MLPVYFRLLILFSLLKKVVTFMPTGKTEVKPKVVFFDLK